MIKKFSTVLAALFAIVLLCSGCSDKQLISTAYEIYKTNIEDLNNQEGLSLSLFGTLTDEYNDNKSTTSISGYFMRQGSQSDSVLSFSYLTGEYYDYSMKTDGEIYVFNTKYGTYDDSSSDSSDSTTEELTQDEFDALTAFQYLGAISSEDYIKNVTVEDIETSRVSSRKQYTINLKPDSSEELAQYLMESFGFIDTVSVPVSFDIEELQCIMTVDEETGTVTAFQYILEADMEAEGEVMNAVFKISYNIAAKGDDVSVSVDNLQDYLTSESAE